MDELPCCSQTAYRDRPVRRMAEAGEVAAGTREADGEMGSDWIAGSHHDDRNRCRHILGRERCRRPPGYDQIDVAADQLRREVRETPSASIGQAIVDN